MIKFYLKQVAFRIYIMSTVAWFIGCSLFKQQPKTKRLILNYSLAWESVDSVLIEVIMLKRVFIEHLP